MDWDDVLAARLDSDQLDGFVTVEEAAHQMGMSEQRVRQLVRDRVLRSAYHGTAMLVQPAITNYT
jgi:excisionase family DNA binding protein